MEDYKVFDRESQAVFYNLKPKPIQRMLDFDYLCRREKPSVACVVHPGRKGFHKAFWGAKEILIPVYSSINEAMKNHPEADVFINFASFRSAYTSTKDAMEFDSLRTFAIIAEGVPERQTKELIALAKSKRKTIIGPATVGGLSAGEFRIGNTGGDTENILRCRLYRPGSVGIVSKSGGMLNELFNIVSRTTDGANEGIAIGGDKFPGSTMLEHMLRFEKNPNIKMIVALGEIGGKEEYEIAKAKSDGRLTKPIVAWVMGTCAKVFPGEVQFGHAGARLTKNEESADAKIEALRNAGVIVPSSFDEIDKAILNVFEELKRSGGISVSKEIEPPKLPMDYSEAVRKGLVRKPTNFVCTISSDIGEEPTYAGVRISEVVEKGYGVGGVIGLLWFKRTLPDYAKRFIELSIVLTADHGPAVSGAHNAIVAARAGRDLISSLCSGLLTIGKRFGGAIADAAKTFKEACDSGMDAYDFMESMKRKGKLIPGIGHRVKSIRNPDKRVEILKDFAKQNFPSTKYLDYALSVEGVTTKKAENLILNVDGCIAACFLDLFDAIGFSKEEVDEILESECLNGLFAIARSIGLVGHVIDQKRLGERLYRHPTDDILYLDRN